MTSLTISSGSASPRRLGVAAPISTATDSAQATQGSDQHKGGYHVSFHHSLIASIVATVLASGIAFVPTPAEAAKLSDAERVALEKATVACKEEAKGMK